MRKKLAAVTALIMINSYAVTNLSPFQPANYDVVYAAGSEDENSEPDKLQTYDINHDGKVNVLDLTRFVKYFLAPGTEPDDSGNKYDINDDGVCNTLDLVCLKEHLLGIDSGETESPEENRQITLDSSGMLHVNFDFTKYDYNTIQEYLNIKLDKPKDFPYWGYEYQNVDYVYNDIPLCFMFQYDKLIMIILDSDASAEESILNSAGESFGNYETIDEKYWFEINENYVYSVGPEYLTETDTVVCRQYYVSNNVAATNKTENLIELDSEGLLRVNFDFTVFDYDSVQDFLGIKLDERKELQNEEYEYYNADLVYNGIPLRFMFENDDLVMIIYDSDRNQEKSILNSACRNYGLYEKIEDEYIFDVNGKFKLSLFGDYISDTGREVFKQCYFSKFIHEDEGELSPDCALYYFGYTLDELENALGKPENDPEKNPVSAAVGGYLSNSYKYGDTYFSYVNHYPWKGARVSCLEAGKGTKIMNGVYVGMTYNELCQYFIFTSDKPEVMQIQPVSRASASIMLNGIECELYFDFPMGADSDTPSEHFVIYSKALSADDYRIQNDMKSRG